jgi:hypothetical protein
MVVHSSKAGSHIVRTHPQNMGDIFGPQEGLYRWHSYSPQEYFREIGSHRNSLQIILCGLVLALGFLEALSMVFRLFFDPLSFFRRFCH